MGLIMFLPTSEKKSSYHGVPCSSLRLVLLIQPELFPIIYSEATDT